MPCPGRAAGHRVRVRRHEGASVYSRYAKDRNDVGFATILGFLGVLCLLVLITIFSYGILLRPDLAALANPCIHAAVMGGMLLDRNAMAAAAGIMRPQRLHPAVQGGDRTCSPGGTVDHVAPASALSYPRS
jgi:hypothetical protein